MKYLILFLFLSQLLQAQNFTYFNQKIELENGNTGSMATIPYENGYYTLGIFSLTHAIIYLANIDIEGNVSTYHILDDSPDVTTIINGRQFIETIDGNFALIYQKRFEPLGDNADIVLIKFTKEGQILWTQQYGWEGIDGNGELLQAKDGGFLISGFVETINHTEMYAAKTDSRGIIEWENSYCLNRSCKALSVVNTIDRGCILAGAGRNENDDYDMYVVKIDSLGNQLWDKTYGTSENDPACQVYALEDGNFLLEGGIRENGVKKNYNAKLDPDGEIIWEKIYDIATIRTIQTPLVFREDGGFIGVAYTINNEGNTHPLIMNFDANGNTLWTKSITADPHADCYIKDIDKIEGGYVLTGYKYSPIPQYGWLVTIDKEGNFCEELGCVEMVVDIEDVDIGELAPNSRGKEIFVRVSPNPVRRQATIQYRIPKDGVLRVYDYLGREVMKRTLVANPEISGQAERETILEVEDWASGVYLYEVEIGGERVDSGKILCR